MELDHSLERSSGHVDSVGSLVYVNHTGLLLMDEELVTDGARLSGSRVSGSAQLVSQVGPAGLRASFEDDEGGSLGDEGDQLVTVEGVKDELGLTQILELQQVCSS